MDVFSRLPGYTVIILDLSKNDLHVAYGFRDIWEREPEIFYKNPNLIYLTVVPEDRNDFLTFYNFVKENHKASSISIRINVPNKSVKWVEINTTNRDDKEEKIIFMVRDITIEKNYLNNLLTINERKNMVLHIVAHDLRGMISHISLTASLMEKQRDQGWNNERMDSYIKIIKDASKNSLDYMSDLLELEYLESSQVILNKTRVNVVEKIRLLIETFALTGKGDKFELIANNDDVHIEVDEVKIMLIFENLISNAFKFTPDSGKIKLVVEDLLESVRIEVHDNGVGIPKNLQPHIFEKFTKARRKGIKGEKPVGLGLHIIKHLVDMHQGKIWFDSQENIGTSFYIEFPKLHATINSVQI